MAIYKGYVRTGTDPKYTLGDTVRVVASEYDINNEPGLSDIAGAVGVVRDRWTNSAFGFFTQHIYVVEFIRGRKNAPEELFEEGEDEVRLLFAERLLSA